MHIFYSKDPERCQIGAEIRAFDEVARVRPDRYVVALGQNLRNYLSRHGFTEVPADQVLTAGEAAQELGVPVPVLNSWVRLGKISEFNNHYLRPDVAKLAAEREAEAGA